MKLSSILKVACLASATALFAQTAAAERVLKLGAVGFIGMPIGDAIDQALIPTLEEVSGGQLKIESHYRRSLCGEQTCGEQANQGLLALWTSSTANLPDWRPVTNYFVGIQKESYIINYPPSLGLQKKEKNFDGYGIAHTASDGVLSYTATNILPVKGAQCDLFCNCSVLFGVVCLLEYHGRV